MALVDYQGHLIPKGHLCLEMQGSGVDRSGKTAGSQFEDHFCRLDFVSQVSKGEKTHVASFKIPNFKPILKRVSSTPLTWNPSGGGTLM